MKLSCGDKTLNLRFPGVMGVLNITPDSFSDGGRFFDIAEAMDEAERMVEEGAVVIDVGGESTRPGAAPVSVEEELSRVVPVVQALAKRLSVPISVDTNKPEVMRAAIDAGAGMINDVYALRAPGALKILASSKVAVCLMHMQGEPRTMQKQPKYTDVVAEVSDFLSGRVQVCLDVGIAKDRILIDPGFGFGKTVHHNFELLRHLDRLVALGVPVLAGLSRKSIIAAITGRSIDERLSGSVVLATIAISNGARLIRAHDVREHFDAVRIARAVRSPHYS